MTATLLYFVTGRTSGKSYAGITSCGLKQRWSKHVRSSKDPHSSFHGAISQYGAADFDVVELFVYPTREEACSAEITIISALDLCRLGYNMAPGGDLSPATYPAVREKINTSLRGRKLSESHKAAISRGGMGRTVSDETRRKIAAAQIGVKRRPLSEEHRRKIGEAVHSDEPCQEENWKRPTQPRSRPLRRDAGKEFTKTEA